MIVNEQDERLTPKVAAQDIILAAISSRAGYWDEAGDLKAEKMTEREKLAVGEQILKQFERVQKLFNQSGWGIG
jgi:chorismate mutase